MVGHMTAWRYGWVEMYDCLGMKIGMAGDVTAWSYDCLEIWMVGHMTAWRYGWLAVTAHWSIKTLAA